MEITKQHWEVFRLGNQEKKSYKEVAELMNISADKARELMLELRHAEPNLFPCETESRRFGQQNLYRDGKKLLSWERLKENYPYIEDSIKQKF